VATGCGSSSIACCRWPCPHPRLPWPVTKQFDGNGNYTFGLNEQSMFHEIDQDSIDRVRGMDITVVTMATTDEQGRALLRHLGFPFKEM
jgi:ribosomal protein L5